MAQNIYDNQTFFDSYMQLDRQTHGLSGAPEWPDLRAMLPSDLTGRKVLDLGCGIGWVCRWVISHGAASCHGIDISSNMLDRARSMNEDLDFAKENGGRTPTYEQADLDQVELPAESYDVVFSSLAFHYLQNLPELMKQIRKTLRPGGKLVFSVEHPIFTAPREIFRPSESGGGGKQGMWTHQPSGIEYWPIDAYFREGERRRDWLVEGVRKQHRTMGTYVNLLLKSGFTVTDLVEWAPKQEDLERVPEWESELVRPMFLLVGVEVKNSGYGEEHSK